MIDYPPAEAFGRVRPDANWTAASHLVPSDKSLSHRLLLFAALTDNSIELQGVNEGKAVSLLADALSTLGVVVHRNGGGVTVHGNLRKVRRSAGRPTVYLGPSSAAARLLIGVLAGLSIECVVDGDSTLRNRPFDWIVDPLRTLGAEIEYSGSPDVLPLIIRPSRFRGGSVRTTIGSAQAVSAILFAAIASRRPVEVEYPVLSRNHTQLLAASFGDNVTEAGNRVVYQPVRFSMPQAVRVPKDPSAAAYLAALFWLVNRFNPAATARLEGLCLNPTRLGFYRWMEACGFRLEIQVEEVVCGERVGSIVLHGGGDHKGAALGSKELLHAMIDEVPLAVGIACLLPGETVFRDLYELTFKETNRILATREMLAALGLNIAIRGHDILIKGSQVVRGGQDVATFGDHRLSMTAFTLLLATGKRAGICEGTCYRTSFPSFEDCLSKLITLEAV